MSGGIGLDRRDGVASLTIDSPSSANALTPPLARELIDACAQIDADRSVAAAVVRSSGPVFCAGAHRDVLRALRDDPLDADMYQAIAVIYDSFARVAELQVPTIAAVRGAVVGGGVNLMLATDLRIVAEDARIDSGFLRLGYHPGGGHYALLGRVLPRDAAVAMGVFGEAITGARAATLGLAWEALPEGAVDDRACELAARVAATPDLARMAIGSLRHEVLPPGLALRQAIELERAAQLYSVRNQGKERDDIDGR